MTFHIITIFPEIFNSYFNESILGRALKEKKIKINIVNLRDYTEDKHKTVDDTPFGGGAGMLIKVEPLYKALESLSFQFPISNFQKNSKLQPPNTKNKVFLTSAKGKKWNQQQAQKNTQLDNIIIICGRYEGVDERILNWVDEEISIGDFVLTGGEIGAMTIVDSITRLIPGVLGNDNSSVSESHSEPGILEYPQYTRPEIFIDKKGREHKVPDVLLSGHHKKIEKWRKSHKSQTT
ncbi:tRNA (guanosine(37)-N1)-methyltransferase TrmD [Candidatus Parcubacteria bacterium]|nr:MAG: tRNA (guanosine(37)-N1)-methyltransferase TrmD [Candidatus Parcubacteria bacterium]